MGRQCLLLKNAEVGTTTIPISEETQTAQGHSQDCNPGGLAQPLLKPLQHASSFQLGFIFFNIFLKQFLLLI